MLGYAYQRGLVPVSAAAIERAIELNAVAVDFNLGAFEWGRRAAVDRATVEARAMPEVARPDSHHLSETLDELEARRVLDAYGAGSGHVFNLGHGISQHTDPERVQALVEAVHAISVGAHAD
jgi:hypothetical protein